MPSRRPRVFIGSSVEGKKIAEAIQRGLDYECECTVWSQDVFTPGSGTMEALFKNVNAADFAILIFSGDDDIISQGEHEKSPRDNVLFELGLFMGSLGKDRTFFVYDRVTRIKIPSDLYGITPIKFQLHSSGNMQASLGAATSAISLQLKNLGVRYDETYSVRKHTSSNCDIGLQIGDILELNSDHAVVVSTNTKFEVKSGNSSLQAQCVNRFFKDDPEQLNAKLRKALTGQVPSNDGVYKIGTTVRIDQDHGRPIYFVAVANKPVSNSIATEKDIKKALKQLWRFLIDNGDLSPVAIPLVGLGRGRNTAHKHWAVNQIIKTFLRAVSRKRNGRRICSRLTILVSRELTTQSKLDMDELSTIRDFHCLDATR